MSLAGISFLGVAAGRENHRFVTFPDGIFRVREPGTGVAEAHSASCLVQRVLEPFDVPGPAHLVIIDHEAAAFTVGFVARREEAGWFEATCPDERHPITWQDVDAECWAALTRLLEANPVAAQVVSDGADDDEQTEVAS